MNLQISAVESVEITGSVRTVAVPDTVGLYIADMKLDNESSAIEPVFDNELKSIDFGTFSAVSPEKISVSLQLPVPASWDLVFTDSNLGELVYTSFGGGWNEMQVCTVKDGALETIYSYVEEDTTSPNYVVNSGATAAKNNYVSAIFSGNQLGIIGLEEQKGQQVPHVSGIVGDTEAPVSQGRVWADLSTGLPTSVSAIYKVDKTLGPFAPGGFFPGNLFFAQCDLGKTVKPDTGKQLLPDIEFSELDIAVAGDYVCLFAVTGDGAPLLALFDLHGQAVGTPTMPVGSWNNAGRWITSPTITATPGTEPGFSFAFIEMEADTPKNIYTGSLASPAIEA